MASQHTYKVKLYVEVDVDDHHSLAAARTELALAITQAVESIVVKGNFLALQSISQAFTAQIRRVD
jgi:hypothetical protein